MRRDNRQRNPLLFLLALPSVLFVVVHSLSASGVLRIPYGRIDAVFGGQPGASVVLVSALAVLAIALDRVVDVRVKNGRLSLRRRVSRRTPHVLALGLLAAWLFARLYVREYGWLYTSGGGGFFEATVTFMVLAALRLGHLPRHRTEG